MGIRADQAWRWGRVEGVAAQVERFLYGGTLGLMGGFALPWFLQGRVNLPFGTVSLLAILLCAVIGFLFVEIGCRDGGPSRIAFGGRAALYLTLNSVGIAIYWLLQLDLTRRGTGDCLVVALLGASVAVVWNYLLSVALTWKL